MIPMTELRFQGGSVTIGTKKIVPKRSAEHNLLGNALFSAWVAASCEDARIAECAKKKLQSNAPLIDWESLHLSYAFVAEGALYACK